MQGAPITIQSPSTCHYKFQKLVEMSVFEKIYQTMRKEKIKKHER